MRLAAIFAAVLSVCLRAQTQDVPRVEVSTGYAFAHINFPLNPDPLAGDGSGNLQGWSASGTVNANKWLGVMADFGGYYGSAVARNIGFKPADCVNCTSTATGTVRNIYTFAAGPKISWREDKVTFSFHPLFGAAHVREDMDFLGPLPTVSTTKFSVMLGAGVDYSLSRHFALRGQLDYFMTHILDRRFNNVRVAPGIVFRFGG